jgi:hypothetical protein
MTDEKGGRERRREAAAEINSSKDGKKAEERSGILTLTRHSFLHH